MIANIRAALVAVAAGAVLVLSSCGSGAGDDEAAGGSAEEEQRGAALEGEGGEAPEPDGGSSGESSGDQARAAANLLQAQHLIQTAEIAVEVPDVLAAVRAAESMATGSGGIVQSEDVATADDDITVRVPPDAYERTLREIAGLGTLLHQNRQIKDVTQEVVDVESRIATQRESIGRVRAILGEATRIADVVTLEAELTRRQADLESLLAQQQALAEQVELATVRVHFIEPEAEPPGEEDEDLGFVTGLAGGWQVLVGLVVILLTVLGAVLPFAAFGVPIALLVLWVLRTMRRSNQPAA